MRSTYFLIAVLLLFATSCTKEEEKPEPDPPGPISLKLPFNANPSGNWQIGYTMGSVLDTADFHLSTHPDTTYPIAIWHPGVGSGAYYPYVGQNRGDSTDLEPTNGWAARAGEIVMEGSNSGQYAILRFIVPATGNYKLNATFEGVHFGLSTTDVHILHNSHHLLDDVIEGYGGDPAFHAITGAHPVATYSDTLLLHENDIVTFAVGYGNNKNHFSDTSGLLLDIEKVD